MSKKNKDLEQLFESILSNDAKIYPILPQISEKDTFSIDIDEVVMEEAIPLLPLKNVVLFPGQIIPVHVGRERSKRLVRWIEKTGGYFGALTQRTDNQETPQLEDLYPVGVIAQIDAISEGLDGSLGITLKGLQRFRLNQIMSYEPYITGHISLIEEEPYPTKGQEHKVLINTLKENFIECYRLQGHPLPIPYVERLNQMRNTAFIINFAISGTSLALEHRQALLEIDKLKDRGIKVLAYQQAELQMLRLKLNLNERAKQEIDRHNREFFLQQQMRTIQEELGGGSTNDELIELKEKAETMKWSNDVAKIFRKEFRKAERLNPQSPDYSVQTQYLRTMLSLPWGIYSEDVFDLKKAEKILNAQHYGLDKVKERILEYLAVLKLRGDLKSPIICLYGPPGVGKTSLGKSIAESLGRQYVRVALGGVHDEAEIRGHRRTYIGAMSGRIIQSIQKAGTSNPVFVLDEIDKMANSQKGDPSSALLEVLDPEQNTAFHDNYLDIDYDLSKVLFIATANNVGEIPQALRDRMELIEVSGYIQEEKHQIAKRHLIPKEIEAHGLEQLELRFTPKAIDVVIEEYTRESGVRSLTKRIDKILRKLAWSVASDKVTPQNVTPDLVREYLGKPTFRREQDKGKGEVGVVVGLAWTSVGGDILYIESALSKGQENKISITGNLGDVMKESALLALSYIKSNQERLGIDPEVFKGNEVHIHVPEGAVPKDGPSAGITLVTSLVSTMTKRAVRPGIAMTGEITLRGKVLPVGGIKEKILAAKRSGIKEIIMCKDNEVDVLEVKENYLKGLNFHYVKSIDEVLGLALDPA